MQARRKLTSVNFIYQFTQPVINEISNNQKFQAKIPENGSKITAQDTVFFALWCAVQHLNNYEQELWLSMSGLGDRNTICAIVGGIVAVLTRVPGIPTGWKQGRELLPSWHTLYRPTGPKRTSFDLRKWRSRAEFLDIADMGLLVKGLYL